MSAGPDLTLICVAALVDGWRDGWAKGWPNYWERRARQLEKARPALPRVGASPEAIASWDHLTQAALACRRHAVLFAGPDDADQALIDTALDIGRHADPDITRDDLNLTIAEEQVRQAIDAEDEKVVARLEAIIDQLAPPRSQTTTTGKAA